MNNRQEKGKLEINVGKSKVIRFSTSEGHGPSRVRLIAEEMEEKRDFTYLGPTLQINRRLSEETRTI